MIDAPQPDIPGVTRPWRPEEVREALARLNADPAFSAHVDMVAEQLKGMIDAEILAEFVPSVRGASPEAGIACATSPDSDREKEDAAGGVPGVAPPVTPQ